MYSYLFDYQFALVVLITKKFRIYPPKIELVLLNKVKNLEACCYDRTQVNVHTNEMTEVGKMETFPQILAEYTPEDKAAS